MASEAVIYEPEIELEVLKGQAFFLPLFWSVIGFVDKR